MNVITDMLDKVISDSPWSNLGFTYMDSMVRSGYDIERDKMREPLLHVDDSLLDLLGGR